MGPKRVIGQVSVRKIKCRDNRFKYVACHKCDAPLYKQTAYHTKRQYYCEECHKEIYY